MDQDGIFSFLWDHLPRLLFFLWSLILLLAPSYPWYEVKAQLQKYVVACLKFYKIGQHVIKTTHQEGEPKKLGSDVDKLWTIPTTPLVHFGVWRSLRKTTCESSVNLASSLPFSLFILGLDSNFAFELSTLESWNGKMRWHRKMFHLSSVDFELGWSYFALSYFN